MKHHATATDSASRRIAHKFTTVSKCILSHSTEYDTTRSRQTHTPHLASQLVQTNDIAGNRITSPPTISPVVTSHQTEPHQIDHVAIQHGPHSPHVDCKTPLLRTVSDAHAHTLFLSTFARYNMPKLARDPTDCSYPSNLFQHISNPIQSILLRCDFAHQQHSLVS
jgi:hypothetical protein